MAMAAGAYGGAATDDPPVWGLWFMQWQPTKDLGQNNTNVSYQVATSVVVPWTSNTDPSKPAIADSYATDVGNPLYFTVTGYDRFGDSLILGSPVVFDVDNNKRLEMLAAQPPKHADYLNGKMVNASITNEYYLQTSTSSSTEWSSSITNENTYSNGGSTVDSAKATLTAGIGPFDAKNFCRADRDLQGCLDRLEHHQQRERRKPDDQDHLRGDRRRRTAVQHQRLRGLSVSGARQPGRWHDVR